MAFESYFFFYLFCMQLTFNSLMRIQTDGNKPVNLVFGAFILILTIINWSKPNSFVELIRQSLQGDFVFKIQQFWLLENNMVAWWPPDDSNNLWNHIKFMWKKKKENRTFCSLVVRSLPWINKKRLWNEREYKGVKLFFQVNNLQSDWFSRSTFMNVFITCFILLKFSKMWIVVDHKGTTP